MMETKINILVFGQLADITGTAVVTAGNISDTDILLKELYTRYPLLKEKEFLIAVNQKIITGKTEIGEQASVALLPPFSGG